MRSHRLSAGASLDTVKNQILDVIHELCWNRENTAQGADLSVVQGLGPSAPSSQVLLPRKTSHVQAKKKPWASGEREQPTPYEREAECLAKRHKYRVYRRNTRVLGRPQRVANGRGNVENGR